MAPSHQLDEYEGLEQFQRQLPRQASLVRAQVRPYRNDCAGRVVHPLAQQVAPASMLYIYKCVLLLYTIYNAVYSIQQ